MSRAIPPFPEYPEYLAYVQAPPARKAFEYLVLNISRLSNFTLVARPHGAIERDVTCLSRDGTAMFAFTPNRKFIRVYMRRPAQSHPGLTEATLANMFRGLGDRSDDQFSFEVHDPKDAEQAYGFLFNQNGYSTNTYDQAHRSRDGFGPDNTQQNSNAELEGELYQEMWDGYQRAGREIGYWANYFVRALRQKGAIKTAKNMLRPQKSGEIHSGLQKLLDAGRTDIALEHIVLKHRYRACFTADELAEAQRRIDAFPKHSNRRSVPVEDVHPETLPDTRTYHEGNVRQVLTNVHERDRVARAACIQKHGLHCAVCKLRFEERYGEIGRGFIHVHHNKPLALCRERYEIDIDKDLVPVCPNCHAMLHTSDPPLSVEELKSMLR